MFLFALPLIRPNSKLYGVREIARYDRITNTSSFLFPAEWPYTDADFRRSDETADNVFYSVPRIVTHIDDGAITALTNHYRRVLAPNMDVLDVCSSWLSHLPDDVQYARKYGLGLNAEELSQNKQLTSWVVRDLNVEPVLPFPDETFDAVLNVVSVDYLVKPKEVFAEMFRVLRPGGVAVVSFSNRCFPTKAISRWLDLDNQGRVNMVSQYFYFSAEWTAIEAYDIAATRLPFSFDIGAWLKALGPKDPMFVVQAMK